jgi:hypothetical protein
MYLFSKQLFFLNKQKNVVPPSPRNLEENSPLLVAGGGVKPSAVRTVQCLCIFETNICQVSFLCMFFFCLCVTNRLFSFGSSGTRTGRRNFGFGTQGAIFFLLCSFDILLNVLTVLVGLEAFMARDQRSTVLRSSNPVAQSLSPSTQLISVRYVFVILTWIFCAVSKVYHKIDFVFFCQFLVSPPQLFFSPFRSPKKLDQILNFQIQTC